MFEDLFSRSTYTNLPDLFPDEPALEADSLTAGLNELAKIDGSQEAKEPTKEEPSNNDTPDETAEAEKPQAPAGGGKATKDLAAATDDQLETDDQSTDIGDFGADAPPDDLSMDTPASTDTSMGGDTPDETLDDPLRSLETKKVYKAKFVTLYGIIVDSIATMETYSPSYNNKHAKSYYSIKANLCKLKEIIYNIATERISKMTVDEILRQYATANMVFDLATKQLSEFFKEYNREVEAKVKEEKRLLSTATIMKKRNRPLSR